jgi:hypothetical protein
MTPPVLLDALQIAWMRLLMCEAINGDNIQTAPLKVVAAVLEAAAFGEDDARRLAEAAVRTWDTPARSMTIN